MFKLEEADRNAKHNVPVLADWHPDEATSYIVHDVCCRMLPSMCRSRPVRRSFPRVLDTALRAAVSFVAAALLSVQAWSLKIFAVPYLLLVIAVVTVRPTVGSTMMCIDSQGKGALASAVVDVLILWVGVGRISDQNTRIVVVELLLFVTSTGLAYYFHPPLARRFSLALHALTVIQIANGSSINIYLPVQILAAFVVGYVLSFILVTIPFPRLAKDELLDRYKQCLCTISTVFDDAIAAYLSTTPVAPQVLHGLMQSRLDVVGSSLTVMRRLQTEAKYECDLFTFVFPQSMSVASAVVADPDRVEQLLWICTNLQHTLSSFSYTSYHAAFVPFLRSAMLDLCSVQAEFVQLFASDCSGEVTQPRLDRCRARLDNAMDEVWRSFTDARRHVYGYYGDGDQADDQPSARGRSRTSSNAAAAADGAGSTAPLVLMHTTIDIFSRTSMMYYTSRFYHALTLLPVDAAVLAPLPTAAASPQSPSLDGATRSGKLTSASSLMWQRKRRFLRAKARELLHSPFSWSIVGLHPVDDLIYLVVTFLSWLRRPALDVNWFKSSLKIALIICVASLIAVIPQLSSSDVFPNGVWAAFTAAIIVSDTEGAMWERGVHRAVGTLVGGLVGYLVLLAFGSNWYGVIPLLAVWVMPCQFIQASSYNYLGALAAFTPIVIVFGHDMSAAAAALSAERWSLARMEEIIIGIAVALAISTVLWPVSSIRLLRSEIIVSTEAFSVGIEQTEAIYEGSDAATAAQGGSRCSGSKGDGNGRSRPGGGREGQSAAAHRSAGF